MTGVATLRRLPSSARREELPVLQKSLPLRKTSSWSLQSASGVAGTGLAKRLGGSWMEARAMLFCGRTAAGEQGPPPCPPPPSPRLTRTLMWKLVRETLGRPVVQRSLSCWSGMGSAPRSAGGGRPAGPPSRRWKATQLSPT